MSRSKITPESVDGLAVKTNSNTQPSSPSEGDLWFDSSLGVLKHYEGGSWNFLSQRFIATGGTITQITQNGKTYKVHTFASSGTFEVTNGSKACEYLVIAGGGGAGSFAGGGAGGYRSSVSGESSGGGASAESPLTLTTGSYTVTIGAGGNTNSTGGNTTFASITSLGGGKGGNHSAAAKNGGSGGGHSNSWSDGCVPGGSGTSGQGYGGGQACSVSGTDAGSGGGGAGGAGQARQDQYNGGNGGIGVQSSINGTATYYAGGGAGAGRTSQGGNGPRTPGLGYDNAGGGGTCVAGDGSTAGQAGIVIVRYEI